MNREIVLITSNRLLSSNLKELLELEDYLVIIANNLKEANNILNDKTPGVLIIDELNLKGTYNSLFKNNFRKDSNTHLVIFNSDGNLEEYPFADTCLAMPFSPDEFAVLLNDLHSNEAKELC